MIGSSVAYHLSANPDFQGRVAVIERDPTYAAASSSLSASGVRQQFGTPPNIRMSEYSIGFLRNAKALLSVEGHEVDIGLRERGYLVLGTPEQIPAFEARNQVQRECGTGTELLSPAEMRRRHPWLRVDDLGIGSYGPDREGWFDGPALLQAFRRKARAQGVEYLAESVVGLERVGNRIGAVRLAGGERLACGAVVNAAGAWSRGVAGMAGLDVPVEPRKRCVFVFDSPERIPGAPFVLDASGIFVRPEGRYFICGTTPLAEKRARRFRPGGGSRAVRGPYLAGPGPPHSRLRTAEAAAGLGRPV